MSGFLSPPFPALRSPIARNASVSGIAGGLLLLLFTGVPITALITSCGAILLFAGWLGVASTKRNEIRRLIPVGLASTLAVAIKGDSLMVGRFPCCDIELPLPTVSGHHCRIFRIGTRWYIEDLGSRNGTYVNNRPIRRERLRAGDRLAVGQFEFRVE